MNNLSKLQLAFYTFRIIFLMLFFAMGPFLINELLKWLSVDGDSVLIWNDYEGLHYLLYFVYVFSAYIGIMLYTSNKKKTSYVFFLIFLFVALRQISSYGYLDDTGYHYRTPFSLFEQHLLWEDIEDATFSPYVKSDGGRSSRLHLYVDLYLKEKNKEEYIVISPNSTNDKRWVRLKNRIWREAHLTLHYDGFTKNEESFLANNEEIQQLFLINNQEDWDRRKENGFMRKGFMIEPVDKHEDYEYLEELMNYYTKKMSEELENMSALPDEQDQLKTAKTVILPLRKEWIKDLKTHEPRTDEVLAFQKRAITDTTLVHRYTELYVKNWEQELQTGTRNEKIDQQLAEMDQQMATSKKKLDKLAATLTKQPASTK